jgi:hypothetical protein
VATRNVSTLGVLDISYASHLKSQELLLSYFYSSFDSSANEVMWIYTAFVHCLGANSIEKLIPIAGFYIVVVDITRVIFEATFFLPSLWGNAWEGFGVAARLRYLTEF